MGHAGAAGGEEMINISFDDPNMVENFKAIQALRKTGLYTDEQLQKMYDDQVKKDKEAEDERKMENGRELQEMQEGEILQEALHSEKEKKRETDPDGGEGGAGEMDGQKVNILKPCPFCGYENNHVVGYYCFWVECEICGIETAIFDSKTEAEQSWNRRGDDGKSD